MGRPRLKAQIHHCSILTNFNIIPTYNLQIREGRQIATSELHNISERVGWTIGCPSALSNGIHRILEGSNLHDEGW